MKKYTGIIASKESLVKYKTVIKQFFDSNGELWLKNYTSSLLAFKTINTPTLIFKPVVVDNNNWLTLFAVNYPHSKDYQFVKSGDVHICNKADLEQIINTKNEANLHPSDLISGSEKIVEKRYSYFNKPLSRTQRKRELQDEVNAQITGYFNY